MLLATALLLLAAGCGGDDDGDTVTTSSLNKAEFVKRVNAICERGKEKTDDKYLPYLNKHDDEGKSEAERAADAIQAVLLPAIETENVEIRKLGAPAGDEPEVEAFLTANEEAVQMAKESPRVRSIIEMDPAFTRPAKLANQYGISSCAYR